jgi:hypothetical protein
VDYDQATLQKFAQEIMVMVKHDQEMRQKFHTNKDWDSKVDPANTVRLKEIIETIGWPSISKVGSDVSFGAWLLVQHADFDLDFQKSCLKLMKSLPKNECHQSNMAYLTDRIKVNSGKSQTYGTQFYTNKQGKFTHRPIKDRKNLDKRRLSMGLEPFAEYSRLMDNLAKPSPR